MKPGQAASIIILFLFGVGCAIGCSSAPVDADGDCPVGREGCACTAGGACDNVLTCACSRCVDLSGPSAGAAGAGSGGRVADAGASDSNQVNGPNPPAILLGSWRGSSGSWSRGYTFRAD